MIRTFAAAPDGVVYDPASGRLHRTGQPLPPGRYHLDETAVTAAPGVEAGDLAGRLPAAVCWSPLVRCNLSCPHCLDDTSVGELPGRERARIADILAEAGLAGVDISGGEPLLLHALPQLARRIAAGGRTAVSITTNGWHLAGRAAELSGAVDAVRVSLDGPDAAHHDAWRGAGSFDRALHGVQAALDAGLPVQLQTVLMASTGGRVQAMVDLAARLGVGGVTLLQMLPIGAGTALAEREALPDDVAAAIVRDLNVPNGVRAWLRTRSTAGGFTVVRADGRVWRNDPTATSISPLRYLRMVDGLTGATVDSAR